MLRCAAREVDHITVRAAWTACHQRAGSQSCDRQSRAANGMKSLKMRRTFSVAALLPREQSPSRPLLPLKRLAATSVVRRHPRRVVGCDRLRRASRANLLLLWDLTTGKGATGFNTFRPDAHRAAIMSVAFSSDGTKILSGSVDNSLHLRDAKTGELLRRFPSDRGQVLAAAISPDGTRAVSGHAVLPEDLNNVLRLWDTATGQVMRVFKGHSGAVRAVAFSPDGTRVLSGSYDGTVKLWDAATGELLRSF